MPQPIYQPGDIVSYIGDAYQVAMVLDLSKPPHPGWPTGLYYGIRWETWPKQQFLVIPAKELDRPAALAA